MHKLVCLTNLLIDNLDDLKVTTEKMLSLKNTLYEFGIELNNELSNTETVQKNNVF